ncbi:MAG TPA: ABC transporter ATP-binding protein [Acidimicrobiia bacterium]|nr:ABC transporter ATP-binding protein [Acidimicrobiia bacterium]
MSFGMDRATIELGGRRALDEVDLEVTTGEITAVIGADGAGKSTVARIMAGLLGPDSGTIRRPHPDSIGYQPEAGGTWADLTVMENLSFVASAHGIGPGSGRLKELLAVTGLETAGERLAGALSGGMRQKLAVAMAMLPRPEMTVLDEPTTGLDPVSRGELWGLLARVAGEGTAVLVTSSYLNEAERASHVVVLDEGHVLAAGTAESIRASFPGELGVTGAPPTEGVPSWRRGNTWRVWAPEGGLPSGARATAPDLGDVVIAAALARREP